jgi:hypothetical protein
MRRLLCSAAALALLAGCRDYQTYPRISDQESLLPADAWAQYDGEAAQKIAIGRKLAAEFKGTDPASRKAQADAAVEYAKTLPSVAEVTADTLGYWLNVKFKSGWRVAVLPIADGIAPEATTGLPAK